MQQAPSNPFEETTSAGPLDSAGSGVGWVYDKDSGQIKAVMSQTKAEALWGSDNVPAEDIETY
jgi:hypothetical protein